MWDYYSYSALKVIHLGCLIFWLGPTLGSWWVMLSIKKLKNSHLTMAVYRVFLQTLWLEHIAFLGLIISGATMASIAYTWGQPWLTTKLIIIVAIIIPLEIVDIYLGNFKLLKLIGENKQSKIEQFYHGPFTKTAIILLPPSVLAIFILAVTKLTFI